MQEYRLAHTVTFFGETLCQSTYSLKVKDIVSLSRLLIGLPPLLLTVADTLHIGLLLRQFVVFLTNCLTDFFLKDNLRNLLC